MLVFPFIFGHPGLLYLLLFLVFLIAAFLFNRFLRHSLRNGPHWGKSPVRPVTPSRRPAASRSAPAFSSRPTAVRSAAPKPAPVSRFAYCRRYPDLLALCGGDVIRADRLVDLESRSSGSAAPDVWVNLAISRFPPR